MDKEVIEFTRDLTELENVYIENLEKVVARKQEIRAQNPTEYETIVPIDTHIAECNQENERIKHDIDSFKERAAAKIAEKSSIVSNLITIMDQFSNKLDSDLINFEGELKGAGEYEAPSGIQADTEVAFRISENKHDSIMLGRVIQYRSEISYYDIQDVDDSRKYSIPESQVFALGQMDFNHKKLSKGDKVFALYPDTTIFYPAVIIQAPRRSALNAEAVVIVQFEGDEDPITGTAPIITVQLKYIVKPLAA
ncbi:hypothetical protein EON65_27400 [archaeon]|nr:MAG: hypothetical protein EON65_27400 [archaeon]